MFRYFCQGIKMTFREKPVWNLKNDSSTAILRFRSHEQPEAQTFILDLIASSYETKFGALQLRQKAKHYGRTSNARVGLGGTFTYQFWCLHHFLKVVF